MRIITTGLQALVAVALVGAAFGASAAPLDRDGYHRHHARHHLHRHHVRHPVLHRRAIVNR